MGLIKKVWKLLVLFVVLVFVLTLLSQGHDFKPEELIYGTTFSDKHAKWLSGDKWKDNYSEALDDLKIKNLRIPAYWDEIQKNDSEHFYFEDLDWMIDEAGKRNAKIILAIGYRLPRWPECHLPVWAQALETSQKEEKTLAYAKTVIERYKNHPQIIAWQVENEPFLNAFGECPEFNSKFLDQEIALFKNLDKRPIVVTDSGELSIWAPAAKRADIFGTSMYLNTYAQSLKSYISYPIGPAFFHFKRNLSSLFANPKKWVVIEMQAEPWGPMPYTEMSEKEKSRTMDLPKLRKMLEFGRRAGFQEFYLWGVEWWYWEKETKNNPVYWQEAKKIFNRN
jgi:hypothetical protein